MKFRNTALLLIIALLVSVNLVFAQDNTIAAVAAGDENFSTLVELVTAAGLAETLSGEGSYTVFAPTNEAFEALGEDVLTALKNNPELLTRVLTYHVLPLEIMSADVSTMMAADSNRLIATTVEGGDVVLSIGEDGSVWANNAAIVTTDLDASNGVIHAIDTVLIPEIELETVIPADVQGDATTAGSSTVYPLSQEVVAAFKDEGYAGEITVESIGTGGGFERFCSTGEADVANASRAIKPEEAELCAQLDPVRTPIEFRVGTDALAVVVHPDNDWATDVTLEELALIFGGAELWADVNPEWPEEPILRFIPGTDSGTFDYFVEEVFEDDPEPIQQQYGASTVQMSEDDNVLEEGVANNPNAIGFFGYAYYAANADALKILAVEGVEPVQENVDNNSYPLARPLFIYSDAGIIAEKPQVGQFISYYLTNVSDLIVEVGYFPANEYDLRAAKLKLWVALQASM